MIKDDEKDKFRREKLADYEKLASEYQNELKEKYKYYSRDYTKIDKNTKEYKKQLYRFKIGKNVEKIKYYNDLILDLKTENSVYIEELKKL